MKKSVRSTLINSAILVLALLAVALYYFLVMAKKPENNRLFLDDLPSNDIRHLGIESNSPTNRYRIALESGNDGWEMTLPYRDNADGPAVTETVNALTALEYDRVFTNGEGLKAFGISEPLLVLNLRFGDHPSCGVVDGGISSDGKFHYFSRTDRSQIVYLVKSEQTKDLFNAPDDYRDKSVFTLPVGDIESVDVQSGGKTYSFSREEGEKGVFLMKKPLRGKTDSALLRIRMAGWRSLSVARFLPGGAPVAGENPLFSVRLVSGKRTEEIRIGRGDGNGSYPVWIGHRKAAGVLEDPDLPSKFDMVPFQEGVKK